MAGEVSNIRDITLPYGLRVVVRAELYTQRLVVARGEVGLSYTIDTPFLILLISSFINMLVLVIASFSAEYHWPILLALTNQRKVTLYGARARETPEDIIERYCLIFSKV